MLSGKKDSRGNIINDSSIKNWFGSKREAKEVVSTPAVIEKKSPTRHTLKLKDNYGGAPDRSFNYARNNYKNYSNYKNSNKNFNKSNMQATYRPRVDHTNKENEAPKKGGEEKLTKTQVKKYASEIKKRANRINEETFSYRGNQSYGEGRGGYYNKGQQWGNRKPQDYANKRDSFQTKAMKQKFSSIIKTNQKLKETTQIEEDRKMKPKFNGQLELNFPKSTDNKDNELFQDLLVAPGDCIDEAAVEEQHAKPSDKYIEVERVLGRRIKNDLDSGLFYLIQWKGSNLSSATWEHVSELSGIKDKLVEFEIEQVNAKKRLNQQVHKNINEMS